MTSNLRAHRFEVVHDIDEFKAVLKNYLCVSDECRQHNEAIPSFSALCVEHEVEMQQLRKELELLKWEKGELQLTLQDAARGVGMCDSPMLL